MDRMKFIKMYGCVGIGTVDTTPTQIELLSDNLDIKLIPPCPMDMSRHYIMVRLRNLSDEWTELKIASILQDDIMNPFLQYFNLDCEYDPFKTSMIYKRALKPLDDDLFEVNGQVLFKSGSRQVPIFKTDGGKVEVYIQYYDE